MILDARYEKVRDSGYVQDQAVLIAYGICPKGKREVLGISVSLSEAEVHWRTFLQSLCERKLHGVKLIASDSYPGLNAAIRTVLPSVSPSCLSSENKHEV